MAVYLITYELHGSRDYKGLTDVIGSFDAWWHYIESTWLVVTNDDANEIFEKLRPHLDEGDYILITKINKDNQGSLPKKAWDWIKQHIDK
jgi:uncharacterized SAM-dependent methyltransferase